MKQEGNGNHLHDFLSLSNLHRVATEVKAEEAEEENRFTDYLPEDIPVYTDDWNDDLSDLPPYEEK